MPGLGSTDIKYKLSTTAGSAGNTTAQADPNASLGKYISTTEWADNTLNNLFDDVSGAEASAGDIEYRCMFIHNAHATAQLITPNIWLQAETAGGGNIAIGLDPAGVVPVGQAGAQAAQIVDEQTAPAGVSFSSPTTEGAGLSIGTINAGQCAAVWVRRTVPAATASLASDSVTFRVKGDTV